MVTETQGQLKTGGSVTLDGNGNGTITVMPDNARQRWEIRAIDVSTNQAATAVNPPIAECFVNDTLSRMSSRGSTWSGNRDHFGGLIDVGSCDVFSIVFSPGPGGAAPGVIASAIATGSKFTRRT